MTGFLKMVKLDFLTMKSQLAGYLSLVFMVIIFGFMNSSIILLCVTGAWFVALMSNSIFAIQEKNNLDRLYGSVSVKLKDIVLGRYAYIFLTYFVSILGVIAVHLGFVIFRHQTASLLDIILGFSISFLVYSAITGIQIPMFLKMGYTKAKIWSMVPFGIVMILIFASASIPAFTAIIVFMKSHQIIFLVSSFIISCIIEFLSYKIAVTAYRKRS